VFVVHNRRFRVDDNRCVDHLAKRTTASCGVRRLARVWMPRQDKSRSCHAMLCKRFRSQNETGHHCARARQPHLCVQSGVLWTRFLPRLKLWRKTPWATLLKVGDGLEARDGQRGPLINASGPSGKCKAMWPIATPRAEGLMGASRSFKAAGKHFLSAHDRHVPPRHDRGGPRRPFCPFASC